MESCEIDKGEGKLKTTIKTKDEHPVSVWSGGTTTQLYLYPQGSDYARRDFRVRISSATVDCERSEFTSLPGVSRIILPLKGSLRLYYEGHGEKLLHEYEQDQFDGAWRTTSVGRATDFNLMLREGASGTVDVFQLGFGECLELENGQDGILAVYVAEGTARYENDNLEQGTMISSEETGRLSLCAEKPDGCRLICVKVQL